MSPATIGTATKPCPGRTRSQKCLLTKGHFGVHQYPPPPLLEKSIQDTVTQFLELDGWRAFKMEAISERGFIRRFMAKVYLSDILRPLAKMIQVMLQSCMRAAGVGEVGMPDHLYIRYPNEWLPDEVRPKYVEAFWIEFKRPGEGPRADQLAWQTLERKRGALVLVVHDIDKFIVWYKASGLARRCA